MGNEVSTSTENDTFTDRRRLKHSTSLDSSGIENLPKIAVTSYFEEEEDEEKGNKSSPQLPGQRSLIVRRQLAHFSDFSLYPDRFSGSVPISSGKDHLNEPFQQGVTSSSSSSVAASPSGTTHNVPPVTKYNFRIRTNSDSGIRQGSNRLYYFDFSCLPEKDPRCVVEERRRRVRSSSQGDDTRPLEIVNPLVKTSPPNSSEAMKAPTPQEQLTMPRRRSNDYSFFDYSLIPDKMGPPELRRK